MAGLSLDELRAEWARAKVRIGKRYADDHERFLEHHLDKPLVDYIHVQDGPDVYREDRDGPVWIGREPGFRRQGIGTTLYEVGARWMAENGMRLWASGLQSEQAQGVWATLSERYEVGEVTAPSPGDVPARVRRYLDGSAILFTHEAPADLPTT